MAELALQPPDVPPSDGTVRLRLPDANDAEALAAYASQPGQLDGIWVPASLGGEPLELLLEVAGTVRQVVAGTGEPFVDARYVCSAGAFG